MAVLAIYKLTKDGEEKIITGREAVCEFLGTSVRCLNDHIQNGMTLKGWKIERAPVPRETEDAPELTGVTDRSMAAARHWGGCVYRAIWNSNRHQILQSVMCNCSGTEACERCGWNQAEEARRKEQIADGMCSKNGLKRLIIRRDT